MTQPKLIHSSKRPRFHRKTLARTIALTSGLSMMAGALVVPSVVAQENEEEDIAMEELVIQGQRSSIESAQMIKRNSDAIVDSIVAEDIGKLPDRSVAEALQRVPGVTVSRFDDPGDPEHFAGEGAGVTIRGLPQVRGELNGREIFSAGGGRGLSFDDVPAELMAGVDVYKTPTPDMVEGGLGGIVDLRTRMPFDADGQLISVTGKVNYADLIDETNGEFSGLYSNRWNTGIGEIGVLVNLSHSDLSSRSDNVLTRAFFPRIPGEQGEWAEVEPDRTVYVPRGADWRRSDFTRERQGQYLAVQWAPNEDAEFFLTAFRSEAERSWLENAFFLDAGGGFDSFLPVKAEDDWTYDDNNALTSGTVTTNVGNGMPFGTSTRLSENISETMDISTGFDWNATDQLTLSGSLQYVDSTAETTDNTLGLVAYPDEVRYSNLNNSGSATDIQIDPSFLSDYGNYSYGQMMQIFADNEADSVAVRFDVEYEFEDSIFKSVKTGVRYSDKSAVNRGGNTWSARYQPWMVGTGWQPFESTEALPKLENTEHVVPFSFDNFQDGGTNVPVDGYMFDPNLLDDFAAVTDSIVAASPGGNGQPDFDQVDPTNPDNVDTQDEQTQAIYVRGDFGFEDLAMPVRGTFGVRVVRTENAATGQVRYPTFEVSETDEDGEVVNSIQPFYREDTPQTFDNDYTHVLPSLNLRMHPTDDVILRFSAARGIWRPEFWRMRALSTVSASFLDGVEEPETIDDFDESMVDFALEADGNPMLEPMVADQVDLTAEWYFDDNGGMAYLGLFYKDVEDFFRTSTVRLAQFDGFSNVLSTRPVNTGEAEVQGFEVGFTKFFDNLPSPWNSLGVQGNYTYVDSTTDVPFEEQPVDTDGSTFENLPLDRLSEHTYNLMAMYERESWSTRLAWNWRSEQLLSIGANGFNGSNNGIDWRLPVFEDSFGQLDFNFEYRITDQFTVSFDAYNINRAETVGFIRQNEPGDHTAFVNTPDVRYSLGLRANF